MSNAETPSPSRSRPSLWSALSIWLKRSTHPAPWVSPRWHHPAIGYLAAILLVLLASSVTVVLQMLLPSFSFLQALVVLVIVLIAFSWGQGPSLLATLLGALLLISVITPPFMSWALNDLADLLDLLLFLAAGLVISLLAGQTGRARWHAEQQAHEAEAARRFLARVLEVLPVGVCLVDANGQQVARNVALEALGVDVAPLVARVLGREAPIVAEERAMTTNEGGSKTLLTFAVPVGNGLGVVLGGVVVVVDISERKHLEEALRAANQQMDRFLGIASHELRTPLTTIKLHFQLAHHRLDALRARELVPAEQLDSELERVQEQFRRGDLQAGRLDRLVNDLLDVSRIQAGKLELRIVPANLAAIVGEAIEEQRQLAPSRVIHFQTASAQSVMVSVDTERISQVVTNYLTNALKYSREEQPVTVGVQVEGQQARVWVRDEGPGIPLSEQAQVWERFHRVPGIEVQCGSGVGLGLGLHISQEIIERHHGQVGVESAPGHGSTFWFSLPLVTPG